MNIPLLINSNLGGYTKVCIAFEQVIANVNAEIKIEIRT
jgi:hypothetical protein